MADAVIDPNSTPSKASASVAQALGLPAEAVLVGVGTAKEYGGAGATTDDLGNHTLSITITDPKVGANFKDALKDTLAKLSGLPALKEMVQFESDAANVVHQRDALEKFRVAGAQIPENFKEWIGFNPDNVDRWDAIPKHALHTISRDETGVSFSIRIPEGEDVGKVGGAVKADLEARKDAILAMLQKRAIKYLTKGLDDAAKAAKTVEIAEQFKQVKMEITYNEPVMHGDYSGPGSISVRIASQAQKESGITFKDKVMTPEDKEKLRASNPLTASNPNKAASSEEYAVSGDELGKALGRAVLFEGEHGKTPTAIFPKVAGKEDMKRAIAKQLVAFKATNPGMAKEVDNFLNDEAFKGDDWNKPKRLRQEHKVMPIVSKDATDVTKANTMTVSFSLKADKAQAALEGLANLSKPDAQVSMVSANGDADLAAIADTLVKAGQSLAAYSAKFRPAGGFAKSEDRRMAQGSDITPGL